MSLTQDKNDVIEAIDAKFQERRRQVPVLHQRAEAEGITAITSREDMVPLLFPHTTYKSYPESLIAKGRWSSMNRWIDSLSTHRVTEVDVTASPTSTSGSRHSRRPATSCPARAGRAAKVPSSTSRFATVKPTCRT